MSEAYKKALHQHFLSKTPIKYSQVTNEQWDELSNTTAGAIIRMRFALRNLGISIKEVFEKSRKDE